jgi:pyruvate,water dikinase
MASYELGFDTGDEATVRRASKGVGMPDGGVPVVDDTGGLTWTLEPSHFPAAPTRWGSELTVKRQTEVITRVFTEAGLPIETLAFREFGGRVYTTIVPLGGKARKPPPKVLLPVLLKVVPELRRRVAASRSWADDDRPTQIIDEWLGGKERKLRAEGRRLIAIDADSLSGPRLADLIDEVLAYATDAWHWHFRLHGAAVWQIGILGRELEQDHGWTDIEFAQLFTGLSDASTAPGAAQQQIVELIDEAGGRETLAAATSLEDVRQISLGVRRAVDEYLDSHGLRAVRYEVAYPTVAERPDWLLSQLQTHRPRSHADDRARRAEAEKHLFESLGDTPETRARLDAARRTFPVREGNEAATVGLPIAVLRRVGLAAGRRLARAGNLERPEDIFDLTVDEVTAMLRSSPIVPPDPALRARARREAREAADSHEAPPTIGPRSSGLLEAPDMSGFPDSIVIGTNAMVWYTTKILGAQSARASTGVTGDAVSPGVYEGPARVVMDESELDRIESGDVLVCPITSPVWSMVFPALGALVCDSGGPLSHPAIIAREFAIPAVVNTGNATSVIADGATVRVDGDAGTVTVI